MLIKLKQVAEKLGKNISDIARETGINRNTITALYHGKSTGIQFATLDRICSVYNLSPSELFEQDPEAKTPTKKLYKQEGEAVPFTIFQPISLFLSEHKEYGSELLSTKIRMYAKDGYFKQFFEAEHAKRVATKIFHMYSDKDAYQTLWNNYLKTCTQIDEEYRQLFDNAWNDRAIEEIYEKITGIYDTFWACSLFIDAFDTGADHELITSIAKEHNITPEDVQVLTTVSKLSFTQERQLAVYNLADIFHKKQIKAKEEIIGQEVEEYRTEFSYYRSTYSRVSTISLEEAQKEIWKLIQTHGEWKQSQEELHSYQQHTKEKKQAIVQTYGLSQNPLWFFAEMTFWREHRKQFNLKGIHVLHAILERIQDKVGIAKEDLTFLLPEEFPLVMKGLITQKTLHDRRINGIFIEMFGPKEYCVYNGQEGYSMLEEIEKQINGDMQANILEGRVASQGYAKGTAKVILTQDEFHHFQEGDILVTGMTRPEFVPIMKKAAAIVTNEGGITCHAAIVSRELGKPCIIGTQNATALIKSGDIIEVRANHGTVRILHKVN